MIFFSQMVYIAGEFEFLYGFMVNLQNINLLLLDDSKYLSLIWLKSINIILQEMPCK